MEPLNLPAYAVRTRQNPTNGRIEIWDTQRRKWVKLTPEEWVRQHFVNYLKEHCHYPGGRIGNEITIRVAQTEKRCDTVVYGNSGEPRMIVEYKAPDVELTQQTFDQIWRYNTTLQTDYLVVTNGRQHYCCRQDKVTQQWVFLRGLPAYQELTAQ